MKQKSKFESKHNIPSIGSSRIMSPFSEFFTWQCISVTEIIEQREDYIKFKTENSNYKLFKI